MKVFSRYPGGKSKYLDRILPYFRRRETEYREPFIGGGSVYLAAEYENAWINDIDPGVYDMWRMVKENPELMVQHIIDHTGILEHDKKPHLISRALDLWKRIRDDVDHEFVPAGYRFLFLTRTCFSGVPTGGPTGGIEQQGEYTIYARWAPQQTIDRIRKASVLLQSCRITNLSYEEVIQEPGKSVAIFADPPYLNKGDVCYEFAFSQDDHKAFAEKMVSCGHRYLVTIDHSPEIVSIWKGLNIPDNCLIPERWSYSMTDHRDKNRIGEELFIVDQHTLLSKKRRSDLFE